MRWPLQSPGRLAQKLAGLLLLSGFAVALAATAVELTVAYVRDIGTIQERMGLIGSGPLRAITESAAAGDGERLQALLDGITRQPDIVMAEVQTDGTPTRRSGAPVPGDGATRVFPLQPDPRGQATAVGVLVVRASYQGAVARSIERLAPFLGANLVTTSLFGLFCLWVFYRLIGRHLGQIAETVTRFEKITRQVPGVVYQFCLHPDGRVHFPFASEGIRHIYRVSPQQVREDASILRTRIHPDDLAGVTTSIMASARTLAPWRHEYRVCFDDGTVRWLFGDSVPQAEPDGTVSWTGFITDITERKRVEDELRIRKSEMTRILDAFPGAAFTVSADLTILYASQRYAELLGLRPEQLVGHGAAEFLAPERLASLRRHLERTRAGERVEFERDYAASAHHDALTMQGTYVAGQDPRTGDWVCYCFATDVSKLKASERALREARDTAQAASRAKSEFLASVSHELRTPLNAILGYSQLLAMDASLPEFVRHSSGDIDIAGRHLLSLVNDLIDLGRIESGRLDLFLDKVDLAPVLHECLAMVGNAAAMHRIVLVDATAAAGSGTVWADAVRLRQVLVNLLSNAIKYNRPGGSVRLSCRATGGVVRLSVTDTGRGIASDKRDRLFNAFDRLGEERGAIEGSGIGLVITERLVGAMGGRIGFESTPGQGSTFWVELPQDGGAPPQRTTAAPAVDPDHDADTTQTAAAQPGADARRLLLYIEDNPMNLRLMHKIVALRKDLQLRSAPTAEDGIALARTHLPALVLMDINLPGMDGFAALSVLQGDPRTARIPVIAVSANAMKGDRERGLAAGFADYLTKPLDVASFLQRLDGLVPEGIPA